MQEARIPYVDVAGAQAPLRDELLAAVAEVIDHGQFILGPKVEEFEAAFSRLCGVEHAVGVNSGTDALMLVLRALDIGPGDEVITAPNSFVASASCIAARGARPVFVDVRPDYNLDPALLEDAITPRTRAIVPVHLTGRPADMDAIMAVATKHGLAVVEDAAQAVCARYRDQSVGSFGNAGCFSLHPLKTLGACGDAGIITTNDAEIARKTRLYRNLGLETRDDCTVWSSNSRLDAVQAALLLVKLPELEGWTERRCTNARRYCEALSKIEGVDTPVDLPHERAVYHTYMISAEARDLLKEYLAMQGIDTAIHYPVPIHLQTVAKNLGYLRGSFPVAERLASRVLSLPVYPKLTEQQIERVCSSIRNFYAQGLGSSTASNGARG
ncbi:MAG: DegT/DnrJ/EryC1/StrS family aminotransferase [Myxococcales bacterium]|nr:DegT/DnrJ/EryC1/StrS family aminotransferase [Myxococcales bacterium]